MPKSKFQYVVEGRVTGLARRADDAALEVHAFVGDQDIAHAPVKKGQFKLAFEGGAMPPSTELRLMPADLNGEGARMMAIGQRISPYRFQAVDDRFIAHTDLQINPAILDLWKKVCKNYHMHGTVYATRFVGGMPTALQPLPAVRLQFYEVDSELLNALGLALNEAYLGQTISGPGGAYDFNFSFCYNNYPLLAYYYLFQDTRPDIRVRISQFLEGAWQQIYEGPVDWNIAEEFHRDYFVPEEDVTAVPDAGIKPATGFRFTSLGLLPVDNTRFQNGYGTSQTGDPVTVSHQPFGGTLRIFGLFAAAPAVTSYEVQIAEATAAGAVTGTWRNVTDPLVNRKWNNTTNQWDNLTLGPDPVTKRYTNIDVEPEIDWHEHALKVTWHSGNEPDGYYALRLIGYDAAGNPVGAAHQMPVMRIDNSVPNVDIDVLGSVTTCGALTLPANRKLQFEVTAADSAGHVLSYTLSATRGKIAQSAGSSIVVNRPSPTATWTGVTNHTETFTVNTLTGALSGCSTLAYNVEFVVQGAATDGYSTALAAQRVRKEMNLVVSE